METRKKAAVMRFHEVLSREQDKSGHECKHGDKADAYSLSQRKTQIRTYSKVHEYEGEKADHRRETAGQNGAGGFHERVHYCLF